ncbi:MAG: hypothetical protein ACTSX4_08015 [Candidatus Helarchaeota archaeon]
MSRGLLTNLTSDINVIFGDIGDFDYNCDQEQVLKVGKGDYAYFMTKDKQSVFAHGNLEL